MDNEQARKKIESFVTSRGSTWTVDSLLEVYLEYYKKGYYISYTAEDCVEHLENELEILTV